MKLSLEVEIEYEEDLIHGDDKDAIAWFHNQVLLNTRPDEGLILKSNLIGDEIGAVKVTRIISDKGLKDLESVFVIVKLERNTERFDNVWGIVPVGDDGEDGVFELVDELNSGDFMHAYKAVRGDNFTMNGGTNKWGS